MGFCIGSNRCGAAGWVAGVLSAPRAGQETMNAISEKAIELTSKWGLYGPPVTPQPEAQAGPGEGEPPVEETPGEAPEPENEGETEETDQVTK